jgi:arginyl-tRNA synthetase
MLQIDVDLNFNDDGEPTFYVSEDGKQMWAAGDVTYADWKDEEGQRAAIARASMTRGHDVVILFDGSDTMIYASMVTAINC